MKNRIFKLLVLTLSLILVIGASVITTAAENEETTPTIISKNLEYGEKFAIMYAVDAATVAEGPVTLKVYAEAPAEGVAALRTYTSATPETIEINGVETSAYVFITEGIAPKDMADEFYAQATDASGKVGAAVKYSVVEYLLERLYGGYDLEDTQIELYKTAHAFGVAAQNRFAAGDAIRMNDYKYVRVVDGTVNGVEKGMFLAGTPLTLSGNTFGWAATAFADSSVTKINGLSYTVADNVLIATRPQDLTTSYFTTQGALGEKTAVYTGWKYWNYCTHNTGSSSYLKFLTNSSAAGDTATTHTHGLIHNFEDGNAAFKIGKAPAAGNASVAQTQFANLNSADKNCFVFESDIMFDIVAGAAVAQENLDSKNRLYVSRLTVLANPTNVRDFSQYNSMMPKDENDNQVYFEISGEYDLEATTWKNWGIGGMTLENNKWYKMVIEYYKAEGVMNLYLDGYLIQSIEGLAADYVPTSGLIQLQGLAYGSSIYVDNTYVGTVDKTLAE